MATTITETARQILTSVSGHGFSGVEGEIIRVAPGVMLPPAFAMNSTLYTGPMPHNARLFDAAALAAYEKANQPRPEPPPDPWLTREDICRVKQITPARFDELRASYGLPAPDGTRQSASTIHGRNIGTDPDKVRVVPVWRGSTIDRYFAGLA